MTINPYAIGSAIIICAWLALVTLGVLLNWATSWSRDTLATVMTAAGLVLAVVVIVEFQRRGLTFRHCLLVAVVTLGGIAAVVIVEYAS